MAASIAENRRAVDVDRELRLADAVHARVLTWFDGAYPEARRDLSDAPSVIYVRRRWPSEALSAVAVVGMRRATRYGVGIAAVLGESLSAAGVIVVSGVAGAAHAGVLRVGGITVGMLGLRDRRGLSA